MLHLVYCAVFVGVLSGNGRMVFASPTTYDQRQTGDVNVQIHLKDVQVVALLDADILEDYTDYDYPYDYADFTLKPVIKPSTSTVTTITPAPVKPVDISSTTSGSTAVTDSPNSTVADAPLANTTEDKVTANDEPVKIIEEKNNLGETTSTSYLKKSCPPSYIMDKKQGRCRSVKNRRRFSLVPLNLRLGSRPMKEQQEEHPFVSTKDLPIRIYKSESIKP